MILSRHPRPRSKAKRPAQHQELGVTVLPSLLAVAGQIPREISTQFLDNPSLPAQQRRHRGLLPGLPRQPKPLSTRPRPRGLTLFPLQRRRLQTPSLQRTPTFTSYHQTKRCKSQRRWPMCRTRLSGEVVQKRSRSLQAFPGRGEFRLVTVKATRRKTVVCSASTLEEGAALHPSHRKARRAARNPSLTSN